MLFIVGAVKQITHNQQLCRFKILQLRYQPLHIFFIYRLWDTDTCFPEMPGFTQVQVGYQQYFFFLPENGPVFGK